MVPLDSEHKQSGVMCGQSAVWCMHVCDPLTGGGGLTACVWSSATAYTASCRGVAASVLPCAFVCRALAAAGLCVGSQHQALAPRGGGTLAQLCGLVLGSCSGSLVW
jgi:hypothetical protein